jgi:hypothetical protein
MIVGSVELSAFPVTAGFFESLVKGTDPAADKAGASAGRIFGAAFIKNTPTLAGALIRNGEAFVATAESQGTASGQAFSSAYVAGIEEAGLATNRLFANSPEVVAKARTEGRAAGQALAEGLGQQLPLFGEEGLQGGRAFSAAFIEGTAPLDAAAGAEGRAAGRAFAANELAAIREGLTQVTAAVREQGAAIVAAQGEQGAAAGAAFSRGQRRAMETGGAENAAFSRLGAGAEVAGFSAGSRFMNAMKGGVALGTIALVAGTAFMAGKFQQSTNILVTAAGEDTRALGMVRQGILDIAKATGTRWQDLTDGMFQIEKAGIRGADGLKVLKAAAQGAREEGADLKTVTGSLTSALLDYHLPADAAVTITNQMKTAAGEAKSTFEEFDRGLGRLLPMASSLHISLADVSGSLAEMTQHGFTAQDASDQLSNAMRNLAKSNAPAQKMMAQLGIDSQDVALKLGDGPGGRGLAGTMQYLSTVVLQHMGPAGLVLLNTMNQSKIAAADAATELNALGPAAQRLARGFEDGTISLSEYRKQAKALPGEQGVLALQFLTTESNAKGFQTTLRNGLAQNQTYNAMMQTMTGGANGLSVALNLTGQNADDTNRRIARVGEAAQGADKNVQGWTSTQQLFNVKMDIFKQKAEAAAITLGNAFLPALGALAGPLGHLLDAFSSGVEKAGKFLGPLFKELGDSIHKFTQDAKPIGDLLGPLTKPLLLVAISALIAPILLLGLALKALAFVFRDILAPIARFVGTLIRDVPGALGIVGRLFQRLYHDVVDPVQRAWADATGWFKRMWSDLSGIASRIWNDITGFFKRIYRDVSGAIGSVVDFISRHWRLLIVIFTGPIGFVIDLIYKFRRQVGGFFEALWHTVSTAVKLLVRDVIGGFVALWLAVSGIARFIWRDVSGAFTMLWHALTGLVRVIWRDLTGGFSIIWHALTDLARFIWRDVSGAFTGLWHALVDLVKLIWHDLTGGFTLLWHGLVDIATKIWHEVSHPFQMLWDGLKLGFQDVVHGIDSVWHKLGNIFRVPINFLIQYVYDDGIVKVWNFVMDVVGEKGRLKPIDKIPAFAEGGGTAGPWRGDDRYIKVGGNEHVIEAEAVDKLGGHGAIAALRSQALGRPVRVMGDGPGSGYIFGGGVLTDIGHAAGAAAGAVGNVLGAVGHDILHPSEILPDLSHMVRGALAATAEPALNGLIDLMAKAIPGNSGPERVTKELGHSVVDKVIQWIRGQDARDAAASALGSENISWDGGPNTIGLIISLARKLGSRVPVSSTNSGGHAPGSYHYKNEAVDFSDGTDTPGEMQLASAFAQHYGGSLAELFHHPLGYSIKDGAKVGWIPSNHDNHVHVAISPASIARGHQNFQPFAAAGGGGGPIKDQINAAAAARGWGGQVGDLDYIVGAESSYNLHARNGKYNGLFQLGIGGTGDLQSQIEQGFAYISGRYGNPANAARFRRAHNWYDEGGILGSGQVGINTSGRPERVLDPNTTEAFERLVVQLERGNNGAGTTLNQHNVYKGVDLPTAHAMTARQLGLALQKAGVNA